MEQHNTMDKKERKENVKKGYITTQTKIQQTVHRTPSDIDDKIPVHYLYP